MSEKQTMIAKVPQKVAIVVEHDGRLAFLPVGEETLRETIGLYCPDEPAWLVRKREPDADPLVHVRGFPIPDSGRREIAYADTVAYVGRCWFVRTPPRGDALPAFSGLMLNANGAWWKAGDVLILETLEEVEVPT